MDDDTSKLMHLILSLLGCKRELGGVVQRPWLNLTTLRAEIFAYKKRHKLLRIRFKNGKISALKVIYKFNRKECASEKQPQIIIIKKKVFGYVCSGQKFQNEI